MINRTLEQLKDMIQIENDLTTYKDVLIQGISIDSRRLNLEIYLFPLKETIQTVIVL